MREREKSLFFKNKNEINLSLLCGGANVRSGSNSLDNNDCGCCKYKISVVGYVLSVTPTGGFPGNLLVDVFISEEVRRLAGW